MYLGQDERIDQAEVIHVSHSFQGTNHALDLRFALHSWLRRFFSGTMLLEP